MKCFITLVIVFCYCLVAAFIAFLIQRTFTKITEQSKHTSVPKGIFVAMKSQTSEKVKAENVSKTVHFDDGPLSYKNKSEEFIIPDYTLSLKQWDRSRL